MPLDRSRGGLGIGLTVVRRLVEQHGGRVHARSEGLGKGCAFSIELPLLEENAEPTAPSSRFASEAAALAFIDIGLPGLDGYSIAREVRSATGEAPWLVALTGYGQPEDRQRALAAGFDEHLTKPVSVAALRGAVEYASRLRPGPRPI